MSTGREEGGRDSFGACVGGWAGEGGVRVRKWSLCEQGLCGWRWWGGLDVWKDFTGARVNKACVGGEGGRVEREVGGKKESVLLEVM